MIETKSLEEQCKSCNHPSYDHETGFISFFPLNARLINCRVCDCKLYVYGDDRDNIREEVT